MAHLSAWPALYSCGTWCNAHARHPGGFGYISGHIFIHIRSKGRPRPPAHSVMDFRSAMLQGVARSHGGASRL